MAIDKDKNTQILVTISHELLKEIEDYQFSKRIKNRSEAIRELLVLGLKKESAE